MLNILLIEDDPGDIILIEETLSAIKNTPYKIWVEKELQFAIDRLRKTQFSIVITDLGLPDSQGIPTLEAILKLELNIPVIVLTGLDDDETGNQAVQLGAQDFMVKGNFDHHQLERSMRYAISRKSAEEDLRASEMRMRMLFENGPEAYFITDLSGNILDGNHVAEKLSGYKKEEIIGKNYFKIDLLPKNQHSKAKKALALLNLGMPLGPEEYEIRNKNGRVISVEMKFFPVQVKGETLVFASTTDITEKKLNAEKEQQYYKNMQLISESTMKMIQLNTSDQVINYIGDIILDIAGKNDLVICSTVNEAGDRFKIEYAKGNSKIIQFAEKVIKNDILNLNGKISSSPKDLVIADELSLINFENQLYDYAGGALNKTTAKLIQNFIKLKELYSISLKRGEKILGHVSIHTDNSLDNSKIQLINTFVSQASIVLENISYQEALHESEERYKILFEDSPMAIAVIGADDEIKVWNSNFTKLIGLKKEEAKMLNIPERYVDLKDRVRIHERLKKEGMVNNSEVELMRMNGDIFFADISIKPLKFNGESSRLVVMNDITQRKHAEEERKKLNKVIEQSSSMVMITDKNGTVEYVNSSFCENIGLTKEEVIGNKPSILKSVDSPDHLYKELWQTIIGGNEWRGRYQNKKKNGELFWIDAHVFPILDENQELTHFAGIWEDVSEKKKDEEELIRAKERAEESDRLKTAFLTNISHEIRTPMNAILGFSGLLCSSDHDDKKKNEFIEIIQSRSEDLMHIINNLVDISKIESGHITVTPTDLSVQSVLTNLYKDFKGKEKLDVEFVLTFPDETEDVKINTDPSQLKRILSNIIENAIKFTDSGKIELGFECRENNCIFFAHDSGIGIDPEKSEIIFDRFMQAEIFDADARGGNGLGLAIAKNLTEILDGSIWFEPGREKGTSFYVSLPLKTDDGKESINQTGFTVNSESVWKDRTILVADDDIANYLILKNFLDACGAKVKHAANGMLAVEALKSNGEFDIVLMDLKMPLMDGYNATRVIRSMNSDIPIIAISATNSPESKIRCQESGFNEFLSKPINSKELFTTMSKYLVPVL